ncbi:MAG: class I SAM-dependent methyltransferase [Rhodoferax sp.]|uniref:class I SAM-dependent methyltransferase n=1 Tax=Rhodoferax sp. TaxID=50421 RepID=UPI002ACE3829|nr:class I SAM-dependent methyltransferase [Rhodoferax sp.]MDZ7892824.1 class I SAM-dependent methyltransferase [Rhodoferax sp.]
MHTPHRQLSAPSPWIQRWSHLIPPAASVLDVACGSGRHLHWFAGRGCKVTGVDQDIESARQVMPNVRLVRADIENAPWPLVNEANAEPELFDAIVVTHYLWRPLMDTLLASLASGGVLLYETFAAGNETVGRPARPDFLLKNGELLQICSVLHIVAYENGFLEEPDRFVQRIAATRIFTPSAPNGAPARYAL